MSARNDLACQVGHACWVLLYVSGVPHCTGQHAVYNYCTHCDLRTRPHFEHVKNVPKMQGLVHSCSDRVGLKSCMVHGAVDFVLPFFLFHLSETNSAL